MRHEARNWPILTDYCNAFNTVKQTVVFAESVTCVPALTPFIVKCYNTRERLDPLFFQMNSGKISKIDCSSGVQQGDAMGPPLLCMPLLSVPKCLREEFEVPGVETFACLDNISIGIKEMTPNSAGVAPSLLDKLCETGIVIRPIKTVALPPKAHVRTPEEMSLLRGIGVCIAEGGGVKVTDVPIGKRAYAMIRAIDGRAEQLAEQFARIPPRMRDK